MSAVGPTARFVCLPLLVWALALTLPVVSPAAPEPRGFSDDLLGKTVGVAKAGDPFVKLSPDGLSLLAPMSWVRYTDPAQQLPLAAGTLSFELNVATAFRNAALFSNALQAENGKTYPGFQVAATRVDDTRYRLDFRYKAAGADWTAIVTDGTLDTNEWYVVELSWGPAGQSITVNGKEWAHGDTAAGLAQVPGYTPAWWGIGAVYNKQTATFADPAADEATCYPFSVRDLHLHPSQKAPARPPVQAALPPAAPPLPAADVAAASAGFTPDAARGFSDPLDGKTAGMAKPGDRYFKWGKDAVTFVDPMSWIKYPDAAQQLPSQGGSLSFDLLLEPGFNNKLVVSDACGNGDGRTYVTFDVQASRVGEDHFYLFFGYWDGAEPDNFAKLYTPPSLETGRWYSVEVTWGSRGQSIVVDGKPLAHSDCTLPYRCPPIFNPMYWGLGSVFNNRTLHSDDPAVEEPTCYPFSIRKLQVRSDPPAQVPDAK